MTIQSTDRKAGPFLSGTALPFEFKVFSKEDIAVIYTNAEGVEVVLVLDSDYSVTLNADQDNNPGGTATLTTPIVSGDRANIIGDLGYDQGTDIRNQGGFEPEIIEDALDRATIQIQQLKEISDRTLKTAPGDSRTGDELLADIFEAEENAAASAGAAAISAAAALVSENNAADSEQATADAVAQVVDGEKALFVGGIDYTIGVTTSLVLPSVPAKSGTVKAFWDGGYKNSTEWALVGDTITFTDPITAAEVEVAYNIPSQFVGLSEADLIVLGNAQAAAQTAQAGAELAQVNAEIAEGNAEIAEANAEAAAAAALAASNTYADTVAGLAGTVDGDVFLVVTADPQVFNVYDNQSGVAVLLGELRIADARLIQESTVTGLAWLIQDSLGRVAVAVRDDGTFQANTIDAETLGSTAVADIEQAVAEIAVFDGVEATGFVYVIKDIYGRIAFGIRTNGSVVIGEADVKKLTRAGSFARLPGAFTHEVNYISNSGQSNAGGNTLTDLTTTQEYDNVGFPSLNAAPTTFLPLTLANTRNVGGTYRESPLYGGLGHTKELLLRENGISFGINDYLLVGANNAVGATAIADLDKGSSSYNATLGQVQAAYNLATAQGKSMAFPAVFWTQGESDQATANYGDLLRQLVNDYNTDGIAITGQTQPVHLISWQCSSSGGLNAGAQTLRLANDYDLVHLACPAYIFDYDDTVHINSLSAKWLGGYYGLVYKRVIIDKQKWEPLQPVGHAVLGNTIDLIFNKTGLVFDTTAVPAQTNQGFSLTNAGGATITNVEIVQPNRVRLTCSTNVATGWVARYGFGITAVGKGAYIGAAGNLRDSQGDSLVYQQIGKRMDNWSVLFNYTL